MRAPRFALSTVCLLTPLFLLACGDPNGATASGAVVVGGAVDAGAWLTVEVRACPSDAGVAPVCASTALNPVKRTTVTADGGTRTAYTIRLHDGFTTPVEHWTVVAWLAGAPDAGNAPAPGEWWGSTTVKVPEYNGPGAYAGFVDGTDITVDRRAP